MYVVLYLSPMLDLRQLCTAFYCPSLPQEYTIEPIVSVVSNILWTLTAGHSALNHDAYNMIGWVPNQPFGLSLPWPVKPKGMVGASLCCSDGCCKSGKAYGDVEVYGSSTGGGTNKAVQSSPPRPCRASWPRWDGLWLSWCANSPRTYTHRIGNFILSPT